MGDRTLGSIKAAVVKNDFEELADIDSDLTTWINDGILKIAKKDLSFLIKKAPPIVTIIGENEYALASDFRKMDFMYIEGIDGGKIDFHNATSLFYYDNYNIESEVVSDYGVPSKAIIHSPSLGIKFSAKFDAIYNVIYYYYHVPVRISSDELYPVIPSLYDHLLVTYAMAQYRKRERDYQGYREELQVFNGDLTEWEVSEVNEKVKGQHDMIEDVRSYYREKGGLR